MQIVLDLKPFVDFLNSNFFVSLTTFLTVITAFWLYKRQKNDNKRNAALIILSEIRNAEMKLKIVKKRVSGNTYDDFPLVLTINSWINFSHLFAKDFDQDQLDRINSFLATCQSIDEMANKDNNFFWITAEERARVVQQQLPQLVAAAFDSNTNEIDQNKLNILKQTFLDTISNETYAYSPQKTVKAITSLITNTEKIIDTPIGEKFKKLSK
jgi:hypothetical protein